MTFATRWSLVLAIVIGVLAIHKANPAVADPPPAPPVSSFAPAEDLVGQVEYYVEELEESVENEDEYNDAQETDKIGKKANALVLIALALGLHDTDNRYRKAAPAILKAAQEVAGTKDFTSASAAVAKLKEATAATDGDPAVLKWEKVASLPALMEEVPLVDSRLKRYVRGSRFATKKEDSAGFSAVIAVIAQGSRANADETEKPTELEQWYKFCVQMREAATKVNAAIRAQDEAAKDAAMELLEQSCSDCHDVFNPDAELE